jgi:hypothetical protein
MERRKFVETLLAAPGLLIFSSPLNGQRTGAYSYNQQTASLANYINMLVPENYFIISSALGDVNNDRKREVVVLAGTGVPLIGNRHNTWSRLVVLPYENKNMYPYELSMGRDLYSSLNYKIFVRDVDGDGKNEIAFSGTDRENIEFNQVLRVDGTRLIEDPFLTKVLNHVFYSLKNVRNWKGDDARTLYEGLDDELIRLGSEMVIDKMPYLYQDVTREFARSLYTDIKQQLQERERKKQILKDYRFGGQIPDVDDPRIIWENGRPTGMWEHPISQEDQVRWARRQAAEQSYRESQQKFNRDYQRANEALGNVARDAANRAQEINRGIDKLGKDTQNFIDQLKKNWDQWTKPKK